METLSVSGEVTGFTNSGPTKNWLSISNTSESEGYSKAIGLTTGVPETEFFWNRVVDMSVGTEERIPQTCLVPSHLQILVRVSKESSQVCTCKRESNGVHSEHHWNTLASRGADVSGPLNTDGSFMSFHRCPLVECPKRFEPFTNCSSQNSWASGCMLSIQTDSPGHE
ncbi:hypothetical protein OGAPHI_000995 [Ogataea philodendri]|uniref:Uncharacterized protein n=1 Tax=Ogataea philodendri TaxID=1378263 RepID=A0A9P8PF98_9ASCO|nr:uncharacterized protein OGAPHI_000995 [Ogataea philodendri]KAH3670480.1 hypothetical protein OGAPHI_000995 [Ogataea philodendri]